MRRGEGRGRPAGGSKQRPNDTIRNRDVGDHTATEDVGMSEVVRDPTDVVVVVAGLDGGPGVGVGMVMRFEMAMDHLGGMVVALLKMRVFGWQNPQCRDGKGCRQRRETMPNPAEHVVIMDGRFGGVKPAESLAAWARREALTPKNVDTFATSRSTIAGAVESVNPSR